MQHLGCLIVHIELMQVRERERGGDTNRNTLWTGTRSVFSPKFGQLGFSLPDQHRCGQQKAMQPDS